MRDNPKERSGSQKPPLALIPGGAVVPLSLALHHGAVTKGYGVCNWRESRVECVTYAHALMRHLYAWIDGEDNDPESGLSHWAHIAAGACIVLDAMACETLNDNRPPKGKAGDLIRRATNTMCDDETSAGETRFQAETVSVPEGFVFENFRASHDPEPVVDSDLQEIAARLGILQQHFENHRTVERHGWFRRTVNYLARVFARGPA